jgi:hypothetical protein
MGTFVGPSVGALVLIWLNQQIVSYTEYWPLVLGTILVLLLFVFPGGSPGPPEPGARDAAQAGARPCLTCAAWSRASAASWR